jgi:hypothetical protein
MHRITALFAALVLSACASSVQPTNGASLAVGLGVQVDTPAGWYRLAGAPNGAIVLTKNGIEIESITVSRFALNQSLPNTPKRFRDGMPPDAAADVDISNHQFARGIDGFQVLDRGTAVIDGHPCYHYSYSYLESFGQPRNVKNYGCVVAPFVYRFHYSAPSPKWFAEFLPTFESLVASARIVAGGTPG